MDTMLDLFGNAFVVGNRVAYAAIKEYATPSLDEGVIAAVNADTNTVTITDDSSGRDVSVDASLAVTTS